MVIGTHYQAQLGFESAQHLLTHMLKGSTDMSGDVQAPVIQLVCTEYLLGLELPAGSLPGLLDLFLLVKDSHACNKVTERLLVSPWDLPVVSALPAGIAALLKSGPAGEEVCKRVLASKDCGAFCFLQVSCTLWCCLQSASTSLVP